MADLNELSMTGRLTRDPDLRTTPNDKQVCNFRVACNGFDDDHTVFIDVDVWGSSAESCARYLHQGSRVAVSGRLGVRDWVNNEGEARRSVECNFARVFFLETKAESEAHASDAVEHHRDVTAHARDPEPAAARPRDDDDIPF